LGFTRYSNHSWSNSFFTAQHGIVALCQYKALQAPFIKTATAYPEFEAAGVNALTIMASS
jgi:hypothetical protein